MYQTIFGLANGRSAATGAGPIFECSRGWKAISLLTVHKGVA
jgi:hypothetical protein